jgi:hypothetical protein
MFAPRVFRFLIWILLLAPALAAGSQWAAPATSDREYMVMSRFLNAVDAYVVEHHRLFEPLSEAMMCLPEDTLAKMNALAEVPREARRPPHEGQIFTPDVAQVFRRLLSDTLFEDEAHIDDLLAQIEKETLFAPPVRVNEPLPRDIGRALLPSFVNELPPLPEELEYRLVGRDLVLVDVVSSLVVDVIRAALPID